MAKTFTRLVEEVLFESGATGSRNLDPVAELILEEVLDKHTSQIRYPELFVPEFKLTIATLATGTLTLPSDYQHLDWNSFHIRFGGDVTHQVILQPFVGRVQGDNSGLTAFYNRNATQILVWPYSELVVADEFYLNYWRKSNAKTNNLIVPDSLIQTIKDEAIARLHMTLGGKMAGDYMTLSRDSHGASLGAVDLPPAN